MENAARDDENNNNRPPVESMSPSNHQSNDTVGMVTMLDRRYRQFREQEVGARVAMYPAPAFSFPDLDDATRRTSEFVGGMPTFPLPDLDSNDSPSCNRTGRRISLRKRSRRSMIRTFIGLDCEEGATASDGTADSSSSTVLIRPSAKKHPRVMSNFNKDGRDRGPFMP